MSNSGGIRCPQEYLLVNTPYWNVGVDFGDSTPALSAFHRSSPFSFVSPDPSSKAPEHLQEVELSIMRYKECNKLLKRLMNSKRDVVLEGTVCGYSELGKDSCQVSC